MLFDDRPASSRRLSGVVFGVAAQATASAKLPQSPPPSYREDHRGSSDDRLGSSGRLSRVGSGVAAQANFSAKLPGSPPPSYREDHRGNFNLS